LTMKFFLVSAVRRFRSRGQRLDPGIGRVHRVHLRRDDGGNCGNRGSLEFDSHSRSV
jgi:hypothetical protein